MVGNPYDYINKRSTCDANILMRARIRLIFLTSGNFTLQAFKKNGTPVLVYATRDAF